MDNIFARKRELKVLEKAYESGQPELIAVYGRRRIGKTFLIRQFFKTKGLYFELTGIKEGSYKQQLNSFSIEFLRVFNSSIKPANWFKAFDELRAAIERIPGKERIVLFFDELPWLVTRRSNFLKALEHFWNSYMSDDNRIILILCGSAASWMIKKIIRNKGGLHGRLTAQIRLLPFDLKETENFLFFRGITMERKQLIDVYMAIGGVAKYLTFVEKGKSALQVVNQLFFDGPLFKEFEELYSSLFENCTHHISIVKVLAERTGGFTKKEICAATGISSGGGITNILNELEESGFIVSIPNFGKDKYNLRYRLIDEYSLFYLKWITQAKSVDLSGADEDFWIKMGNTSAGRAWAGYAFESLCMKHIRKIKKALGIAGVTTIESEWSYRSPKGSGEQGAQIDLVIDRADNCINLCEIKYTNEGYVIDKNYSSQLRTKKNIFIEKTNSKKSIFLTLITTYGVQGAEAGLVDVELTMNDLFGTSE